MVFDGEVLSSMPWVIAEVQLFLSFSERRLTHPSAVTWWYISGIVDCIGSRLTIWRPNKDHAVSAALLRESRESLDFQVPFVKTGGVFDPSKVANLSIFEAKLTKFGISNGNFPRCQNVIPFSIKSLCSQSQPTYTSPTMRL